MTMRTYTLTFDNITLDVSNLRMDKRGGQEVIDYFCLDSNYRIEDDEITDVESFRKLLESSEECTIESIDGDKTVLKVQMNDPKHRLDELDEFERRKLMDRIRSELETMPESTSDDWPAYESIDENDIAPNFMAVIKRRRETLSLSPKVAPVPPTLECMATHTRKKMLHDDETVLENDYPVHYDYFYICDGKVITSPLGGGSTVADLKRELGVSEVRRCSAVKRGLLNG